MANNQLTNEIERKAREILKTMNATEIEEKAKQERKSAKINRGIWSAVLFYLAIFWIINLCIRPIEEFTNNDSLFPVIVLIVGASIAAVFLLVDLYKTLHKSNEELAVQKLHKELRKTGVIVSPQQNNVEYNVSKTIEIDATGKVVYRLLFDNHNRVFQLQNGDTLSKLYKFSDVINYEVYENGASKVSGTAGKALIGGAFFGLGGMIVGSSMGRTIQGTCSQLKLIIRLNDVNNPQMEIVYINSGELTKDSSLYKKKIENLQLVCSQLEYMINSKTLEESSKVEQPQNTVINNEIKQQLQTLQELCKDGLITEEEFEQKKKQILGL